MNIVFLGTPEFAVPSLKALLAHGAHISCVITRPDAIRKRGKELLPSPVKEVALEQGIPVIEAKRITPAICEQVREMKADLAVVVAYGALLPAEFLTVPVQGTINVHASLLPRWRGAAPIERAILAGDKRTGVSIMRVVEGLDSGPYCAQASTSIGNKSAHVLTQELASLGADLLVRAIEELEKGREQWTDQDDTLVTLAPKISKEEMFLTPGKTLQENLRMIQASSKRAPAKLALSFGEEKNIRLRVLEANEEPLVKLEPFEVSLQDKRLLFGANGGTFEALRVIPEGKKEMSGEAFVRGISNVNTLRWG